MNVSAWTLFLGILIVWLFMSICFIIFNIIVDCAECFCAPDVVVVDDVDKSAPVPV